LTLVMGKGMQIGVTFCPDERAGAAYWPRWLARLGGGVA